MDRSVVGLAGGRQGTYELDGDTITWHGGIECADTDEGTCKFTIQDNQRFNQTVKEHPCDSRPESFDGVAFKRVSPPNEELLTIDNGEERLAAAGLDGQATHEYRIREFAYRAVWWLQQLKDGATGMTEDDYIDLGEFPTGNAALAHLLTPAPS